MTWAWIETSSAETGSSRRIRLGSIASARATPMRWRWPPENSCGNRLTCSGLSPTRPSSSRTPPQQLAPPAAHGAALEPAQPQWSPDDLADPLAGVQGGLRILKDHLHLA